MKQDIGITLLELAIAATPGIAGMIFDAVRGREPTTEEGRRVRSILAETSESRLALEKELAKEALSEAKAEEAKQ